MARQPRASRQTDESLVDQGGDTEDKKILREAKDRFRRAADWEGDFRKLYIDDVKFANGDSVNGWQWPDNVKQDRDINNRPCLTINKTKVIINKLVNEAKQNPPEPRIKPVGDKASYDAAMVWQDLIRHICYISNATALQGTAKESQLEGGIGYWLVSHDFVDDRSFDQEIRLLPLNALDVFLDCDIKQTDGSDAMWGFVFQEFDRKEFEKQNPRVPLPPARSPGLDDKDDWIRKDAVRVAEYYRIVLTDDELLFMEDEQGNSWTGLRSEIPKNDKIWSKLLAEYDVGDQGAHFKKRKVRNRQLEWFKIAGSEIMDRNTELKGKYVPIVRLVGRERKIENRLYRSGLVRQLMDPQRMYNYNSSGEVEVVALQTKSPWIVAMAAIEGNEDAWAKANTINAAYLTYRHTDDEGQPIPPPERANPPVPAQGFLEGLRVAASELEMASGMAQAQQVNPSLERTPKAIDERMRTGEVVNYDFTDNEMQAVRHTAVIILDMAPYIYDTERVVKLRAKDGTISDVNIDPNAELAYRAEKPSEADKIVKKYLNPKFGKYAVEADVGPAYQTQRQAAWDAFVQIITHSPELIAKIGDLGFLAADFPMAQEIAERLRRDIENTMPWLLKDGQVGPIVKNLTAELQNSQQRLGELMEQLAEARLKVRSKDELRDVEVENAKTRRLTAEAGAAESLIKLGEGHGLKALIQQTLAEMLGFDPSQIEKANKAVVAEKPANGPGE